MRAYAEREIRKINEDAYSKMRKRQNEKYAEAIEDAKKFAEEINNQIEEFIEKMSDKELRVDFNYGLRSYGFQASCSVEDEKGWKKPIDTVKFLAELSAGNFDDFEELLKKYSVE